MLLFLLTAREGRVSANHLGCPSSRKLDAGLRSYSSRATAFVCPAPSPSGIPNDKTGNTAGILYRH